MKYATKLNKSVVYENAIKIVKSAKNEIIVTMDVDEELKKPLPVLYHLLISKKVNQGIFVLRYGFGSKESFEKLKKLYQKIDFIFIKSKSDYMRMLVVDRKIALFKMESVYISEFQPLVNSLVSYTKSVYNKEAYE